MYVGKAKSIRKRLANYFARDLAPRTRAMVDAADSVEWIVTDNEVSALMLEYTLAQEHQPRFNIRLRDDKSFPYLAITRFQEWPRAMVMRGKRRKGVEYFGPYAHAYAIRQTLDLILRTFPHSHVYRREVPPPRGIGPALPALPYRAVLGPLCWCTVTPEEYEAHTSTAWPGSSKGRPTRWWSGFAPRTCMPRRMPRSTNSGARLRDQLDRCAAAPWSVRSS